MESQKLNALLFKANSDGSKGKNHYTTYQQPLVLQRPLKQPSSCHASKADLNSNAEVMYILSI